MSDDEATLQKVRKYSRILRIKDSSYKDVMVSLERLQSLVTSKKLLDTTGVEPVVKNWCRIDDGPASALARKIVKTWQSLNSSSRSRGGGSTSTTSFSSRSGGSSNISSHKNGRSFNRHLLKSPSLSPSSGSDAEATTVKTEAAGENSKNNSKSNSFSPRKEGNTNGDAGNSPSISISSSSDDEKSAVAEAISNINKNDSNDKPPQLTPAVANDVNSPPTAIGQPNSSGIKPTHVNNEKLSLEVPDGEKGESDEKGADDAKPDSPPAQELYSPGNPTGGSGRHEFDLSNSDSSDSPKTSPKGTPTDKVANTSASDATKEVAATSKSVVGSATSVLSSVVASSEDWRLSHQSEKLKNLKRRAALICNLPELASSAVSDKEKDTSKDRRSDSGSPRKRKKYKKEKKSKESRSKKKSSRRKDHRRDYSDSRSRKRGSKSKSRSETKDNLQYDSLSGAESRSD